MPLTERIGLSQRCLRLLSFTMIELLVAITIVCILVAILMPALQGVKEQANSIKCMSNLRQIGLAIVMHGTDRGIYPPTASISPFMQQNFSHSLSLYLGVPGYFAWVPAKGDIALDKDGSLFILNDISPVFECPSVRKGSDEKRIQCHYSEHVLMGILPRDWGWDELLRTPIPPDRQRPYPVSSRTSEIIMMADGNRKNMWGTPEWNSTYGCAAGCFDGITESTSVYNEANAGKPIHAGPNADEPDLCLESIRFRHHFNTRANCLFLDGHVTSLKQGEILGRNVMFRTLLEP